MNNDIQKLLEDRYFLKNETSWEQIAQRVGKLYQPIANDIENKLFIASTPTLLNANTKGERIGTLSSCFPMDIEDSIDGIFDALKESAQVTKYGGGIGYDFSVLRSSDSVVKTINRKSSGPLPFINNFNTMLDGIQQGGVRRGAGMAILNIHHRNILDFIIAKSDTSKFKRFNFSINIPNSFYKTLEKTPDAIHQIKDINGNSYDLIDDDGNKISVKQLWDVIIFHAWKTGEPGIFNGTLAYDKCSVTNISQKVLPNPCQEFFSIPYSSCNLGSINLSLLYDDTLREFNWIGFEETIKKATIFLNNVIDSNKYPVKKIKDITHKIRPIGLGIMGLAHLLYKLEIPYNSTKAKKLTEEITKYLTLQSMVQSVALAKDDGAYEAFDYDLYMKTNERFFVDDTCREIDVKKLLRDIKKYGCRNSGQTSIAPTGSISFIAETSSSIEPIFALSYTRKIEKLNNEYDEVYITDPIFKQYLNKNFDEKTINKILEEVSENKGSCQECKNIPDKYKKIFVTANDITPEEHLNILEAVSKNVSYSVSKTLNLPSDIKEEKISEIYLDAHKRGIIGVTVYRDGCREGILIHDKEERIIEREAPKRPKTLPCHVYRITVHGDRWLVFVGLYKNHPYEVFAGKVNLADIPSRIEEGNIIKVKKGLYQFEYDGDILIKDISKIFESGVQEALTRQISTNLRHGTPVDFITEQLDKSEGTIVDFNKSITRALRRYLKEKELIDKCPICGSSKVMINGCAKCSSRSCIWSECG